MPEYNSNRASCDKNLLILLYFNARCEPSPNMGAQKQVALVVGASRGIGRQVAVDLAKNGYAGKLHVFRAILLFNFKVLTLLSHFSQSSFQRKVPPMHIL